MIRIEPLQRADLSTLVGFVIGIQEFERAAVPELKPGAEVAPNYAAGLMRTVTARNGSILLAKDDDKPVGFVCAWIADDDDPLLREEVRRHAYVSDIFVAESHRRKGVARMLMEAIEAAMRQRGCQRIRVTSKAANRGALTFYNATSYKPYEILFTKSLG